MFLVREARSLAPTITRLVVEAPLVARKHRPGHFVIVRVAEGGERIPLTVVESDAHAGTITLIVQAVGKTTRLVCGLAPGDALADVDAGPTRLEIHAAAVRELDDAPSAHTLPNGAARRRCTGPLRAAVVRSR